jgi:hypothetical protein
MGKMSEQSAEFSELKTYGEKIITVTDTLTELFADLRRGDEIIVSIAESLTALFSSGTPEQAEALPPKPAKKTATTEPPAETPAKSYTKEDVRALLSRTANEDGCKHKTEVRDIVKKYGNGGSLTDIDEKDYPALVAEVESLRNA